MTIFRRAFAALALCACTFGALTQSGSAFVYQGRLEQDGVPGSGAIELEFRLFAQETGGARVATFAPLAPVAVVDGVFVTPVDFGAVFDGRDFFVELGVRAAGSAATFTTLAPRQPIKPAPGAQYAQFAALTGPDSVASGSIVDGSVGSADIDAAQVQRRSSQLATACAGPESSIKTIAPDGSVTCEADDAGGASGGGDITGVAAGTGLTGGGTAGELSLAIADDGVGAAQIGEGAVGTSEVADGTLRGEDAAPSSFFTFGGNSHDVAEAVVLGVDGAALALDLHAGSRGLRLQRNSADQISVIGGHFLNQVLRDAAGATIGGGGSVVGFHVIAEDHGTIAGGLTNVVGDALLDPQSSAFGTIGGGSGNVVRAQLGTIAGGATNTVPGTFGTVPGGRFNCAGGLASHAAGTRAIVRTPDDPNRACEASSASSGDADGDEGTWIWADATVPAEPFVSTGPNQFLARAAGGVAFTDAMLPAGVPAAGTMVIDMPAGVAINRATAQATLHVSDGPANRAPLGSAVAAFENDGDAYLHLLTPAGDESGILFGNSAASIVAGIVFNSGVPNGIDFRTGGNNARMVLSSNGRLGIGNPAPEAPLHIGDTAALPGIVSDIVVEDPVSAGLGLIGEQFGLILSGPAARPDRYIIGFGRTGVGTGMDFAVQPIDLGPPSRMVLWDTRQLTIARSIRPDETGDAKVIQVGTDAETGNGAYLSAAGIWTNASSRAFKEGFTAIDPLDVLDRLVALPITRWRYRDGDRGEHLGPMAEDFRAAFALGEDGRYIGTVDADGVALAAIQGLHAKLEAALAARDREIEALRAELAALRERR